MKEIMSMEDVRHKYKVYAVYSPVDQLYEIPDTEICLALLIQQAQEEVVLLLETEDMSEVQKALFPVQVSVSEGKTYLQFWVVESWMCSEGKECLIKCEGPSLRCRYDQYGNLEDLNTNINGNFVEPRWSSVKYTDETKDHAGYAHIEIVPWWENGFVTYPA